MATQLDALTQLAGLLGGSRTTHTADTTALQNVLTQLQAVDPQATLQTIFQQAAGQIPGIQTALGNAIGARATDNSGIQAALSELLKQTTLAAQSKIIDQQNANLNTQAQIASAIANANKTTTQKANLGAAAKDLLLLQGISKARKLDFSNLFGAGMNDSIAQMPAQLSGISQDAGQSLTGDIMSSNGMDFNSLPGTSFDLNSSLADFGTNLLDFGDTGLVDTLSSGLSMDSGVDFGGGGLLDELTSYGVFADGGLVGRDGVPGYADGGVIHTAGGRRSADQTVELAQVLRSMVDNTQAAPAPAQSLQGQPSAAPQTMSGADGNVAVGNYQPNALASGIRTVASNPLGRLLAGLAVPGLAPVMSIAALPDDATKEQAMGAFAKPTIGIALSEATNTLPSLAQIALSTAINTAVDNSVASAAYSESYSGNSDSTSGGEFGGIDGFAGNTTSGSGYGDGMNGGVNAANGGHISGPGTGTSDSIPARLSDGEYVIPADVVEKVGVEFFDMLRNELHTPVAPRR